MKFLTNLFTGSDNMILNAAFSLALVIILILLIAWIIRFFSRATTPAGTTSRRRLSVVESVAIDGRRKLVLVRHGDREHLIMIGGSQDLVVEANIRQSARPRPDPRQQRPKQQHPRQKTRQDNGSEAWRETQRRRQFAASNSAPQPTSERSPVQLRQHNLAGAPGLADASGHHPDTVHSENPSVHDDAEWRDKQSEITKLQDELAENKDSLQQLQAKRLHPGLRAENQNEDAEKSSSAAAKPTKQSRQKPEKKRPQSTQRRTPALKAKSVAKLNIAIQESVTAKKAPRNNDSDTVSARRAPQSVKRAKTGAKKTVSRRKPVSPRPSK